MIAWLTASRRSTVGRLLTVLLACLALSVPAQAIAGQPARHATAPSGTITEVTSGSAADFDPATDELASSDNVARNIQETLVALKGTSSSQIRPLLATSWQVTNGGKTYIFHLRHNVHFHTGRVMTSADVVYSLQRTILAGLTNSYLLSRFISNPRKQISASGPYTVKITVSRPTQFLLPALADSYVTTILDSHALKAHVVKGDYGHAYASTHDLGTGPYTLASWQHHQQVTLKAFPGYWGGWKGKHFQKVVITTIPESTTRRELLERGQADVTWDLTPQDYQALAKNRSVRVVQPYGAEVDYVVMTQAGPLKSRYARQALSYAFDYNALINGFEKGYARRAYGVIPSVLLGYDKNVFKYQTNLSKAKALLQKAGVKPGTTFNYTYYPGVLPQAIGEVLQAQLQQIGYKVSLHQLDEATFNGIFYGSEKASQRPNLMPFGWWPDYNDPFDMASILVSSAAAGAAGANAGYYHDAAVDALLKKMQFETGSRLVSDAHKLQDLTTRVDPPAIWTDEPAQVTVMSSKLTGFTFNPLEVQTYDFYAFQHR